MNEPEFDTWFRRAVTLFPGIAEFFGKTAEIIGGDQEPIQREWLDALKALDAKDADAALTAIRDGAEPIPGYWTEWSAFPDMVRRNAHRHANARQSVQSHQPSREPVSVDPDARSGASIYQEARRLLAEGKSIDELIAATTEPDDPANLPRYRCPDCRDERAGHVQCWHPQAVKFVRDNWLDAVPADWLAQLRAHLLRRKITALSWAMICHCSGGAAKAQVPIDKRYMAIRDPEKHPVCHNERDIGKLVEHIKGNHFAVVGAKEWKWNDGAEGEDF